MARGNCFKNSKAWVRIPPVLLKQMKLPLKTIIKMKLIVEQKEKISILNRKIRTVTCVGCRKYIIIPTVTKCIKAGWSIASMVPLETALQQVKPCKCVDINIGS